MAKRVRIVGGGRAGGSFAISLAESGWDVVEVIGHGDDPRRAADAADGVEVVLIAVPDGAVEGVSASILPVPDVVVCHVAGSLGLDVLAPHDRRGSVHPLMALPTTEVGAERLRSGGWFAVAGDPVTATLVQDLGGRSIEVADDRRPLYHAAAAIASNHVVALLGQVERIAASIGVPLEAYLDLTLGAVESVAELGAASALTGPASRRDVETLARHREALDRSELAAYDAMVDAAVRLVEDGSS